MNQIEQIEFLTKLLISMDMSVRDIEVEENTDEYLEYLRYEVADVMRAYTRDHLAEHKSRMMRLY